jgi:hypothetical protein
MAGARSITFELTREDYLAAMRHYAEHSPYILDAARARRRASIKTGLISMLVVFIAIGMIIWRDPSLERSLAIPAGAAFGLIVAGLYGWWGLSLSTHIAAVRRRYIAAAEEGDVSAFTGMITMELDEKGVRLCLPASDTRIAWDAIQGVWDLGDCILVEAAVHGGLIPKRAFATISQLEELARLVDDRARGAPQRPAGRLAARLADEACACGYNLRGLSGLICPECGGRLRVSLIREEPAGPT